MVVLGYDSTVPVTMEEMLHHCRAVRRGAQYAYLIGDLPFMSYQADRAEAVRNAGRFLKEAGMDAVKLEGGRAMAETVRAISDAGITVIGHIGLTPQSSAKLGGYRVQGRTAVDAQRLLEDAEALQAAGAAMIVLEMVPDRVAEAISLRLHIPTSASAQAAGATARCWCCTTCWGCSTASRRASPNVRGALRRNGACAGRLSRGCGRPPLPGGRARLLDGRVGVDRVAGNC